MGDRLLPEGSNPVCQLTSVVSGGAAWVEHLLCKPATPNNSFKPNPLRGAA